MNIKTEVSSRSQLGYNHISITPCIELTREDMWERNGKELVEYREYSIGFSWLSYTFWIVIRT